MWVYLTLCSALMLGVYDVTKKKSLEKNSVMWALFAISVISTVMLGPLFKSGPWEDHLAILPKAVLVALSWIAGLAAMKYLPLSTAATFKASRPVFVILFSILLFGERLNAGQWAGVGVSLLALALLSIPDKTEETRSTHLKGLVWMIICIVTGVSSALYDKYVVRRLDPLFVQCWANFYITLVMGAVLGGQLLVQSRTAGSKASGAGDAGVDRFHWDWYLVLTAFFIVGADMFYFFALKEEDALLSVISLLRRFSVIVTFVIGVIVFKEKNIGRKALKLALLLCGMFLLFWFSV